ncbi:MAG: cytochrome c [Nitrospirales bacterium]|nr:cytochrome c [Nitrospira sp.]MDR4459561.1 cytochrome c [Nitrospirales bacterium]
MTRRLNRIPHATDEKGAVTWFVGLGLGIIMASLAVAGGGDIEKGKTFYRQSCGHCHGLNGQGDGEMGGYLNPPPANLASEKTQSKSDTELKEVIMKGRSGTAMVGFEGALEDTDLIDLIAYVRSLKP